jgi:hypothetical protein
LVSGRRISVVTQLPGSSGNALKRQRSQAATLSSGNALNGHLSAEYYYQTKRLFTDPRADDVTELPRRTGIPTATLSTATGQRNTTIRGNAALPIRAPIGKAAVVWQ